MRNGISMAMTCSLAMLAPVSAVHAQRQVASSVTDTSDPRFITAQTRKQGRPMPAEQMALIFDHRTADAPSTLERRALSDLARALQMWSAWRTAVQQFELG
jgi:hypothetical protein